MYIVTGGAGFIGSSVVWRLNQAGINDVLIVDNLGKTIKWKNLVNLKYSDYINKDRFLSELLSDRLEEIEGIVHMGACSSTTEIDADYLMTNNFHYSVQLADYALRKNIRFIYASSAATYGGGEYGFSDDVQSMLQLKPLNMYGYSKHLFDMWVLKNRCMDRLVGLKFFNVFGPNEYHKGEMSSVILKAFNQINDSGKIRLFKSYRPEYKDGEQQRDFVYVKDCAELVWNLIDNPSFNGIFNVGSGHARTWNDLAHAVFSAMGLPADIEYIEMPASLKDRYQYFTCADNQNLYDHGCAIHFQDLESAVSDYVNCYLKKDYAHL